MTVGRSWYAWEGDDLLLDVQVQPRASRDHIAGPHGDRLRVRITAPPIEGKANEHLMAFIAKQCSVAKRDVALVSGATGRRKRVRVRAPRQLPAGVVRPT